MRFQFFVLCSSVKLFTKMAQYGRVGGDEKTVIVGTNAVHFNGSGRCLLLNVAES